MKSIQRCMPTFWRAATGRNNEVRAGRFPFGRRNPAQAPAAGARSRPGNSKSSVFGGFCAVRIACLLAVCGLAASCDSGGGGSAPAIRAGETQVWYGRANTWATSGPDVLRADVEACAAAGITGYMIELCGWNDFNPVPDDVAMALMDDVYHQLVGWCRSLGLWLFVSVANDNAGLNRYGDRGIPLSAQTAKIERCIEMIREHGSGNVIVQPCAETRTAAGLQLEARCAERLGGFTLVCNGNFGRPAHVEPWASFRAWHPLVFGDYPSDALVISDTGNMIRMLSANGSVDGPGDPAKLRAWVREVQASGAPVAGYYVLRYAQHDAPAIQALGEGLQP